mgnify:CR=1 FL=1
MKKTSFTTMLLAAIALAPFAQAGPPSDDYELYWADEFEGEALDGEKWGYHDLGYRRDGFNKIEMASLDGEGHLVLTTDQVGDEYHTVMIHTLDRFETTFGYFETRVDLQDEVGHWSAFWLQSPVLSGEGNIGDTHRYGTEIDIYEYLANMPFIHHMNLHWDGYGEHHKSTGHKHRDESLPDGFHTIGLEWTPDEYVFFLDDEEVWRTEEAISHRDQYIILSLEVGEWAGEIADAQLPDSVIFDYVRVYKKPSQISGDEAKANGQ